MTNQAVTGPLAVVECRRCGRTDSSDARFCPGCGAAIEPAAEPSAGRAVARTLASVEDSLPPRGSDAGLLARGGEGPLGRPASMRPVAPELNFGARDVRCAECGARSPANSQYCAACGHGFNTLRPPHPEPASEPVPGEVVQPAAPPARFPHLAVVTQDGLTGDIYRLDQDIVDIGREEGAIRLAADRTVCPRHARISRRAGTYYLQDLGSVNGVYLRLRQPAALQDGDLVLLGAEVLRFRLVHDAEQGLQPATERHTEVYGSPKLPRYACLYERTVEGVTRNVMYITRNETVIGRESGDIVFTGDSFMSRRHAVLRRDPVSGHFSLRDLGSSNGTFIAIRGEVPLADGEHVRVGQHLFRFGAGL